MGYQPRTNIVKGKKGDLFTDSHSILVKWRNHFSQLLNIHGVKAYRNTYTRATFVWAECLWGWDGNWKSEKTQITRYWTNSTKIDSNRSRTIHSESHKIILFGLRRNFLRSGRSRFLYLFIGTVIKQTVVIVEHITFVSYIQTFIQHHAVILTP